MKSTSKIRQRIGQAILNGWSFFSFKFCEREGGRHSVSTRKPDSDGWVAHKVNVLQDEPECEWISRLLDEAGVSK